MAKARIEFAGTSEMHDAGGSLTCDRGSSMSKLRPLVRARNLHHMPLLLPPQTGSCETSLLAAEDSGIPRCSVFAICSTVRAVFVVYSRIF